jgi:hypothetical protein
MFRVDVVRELCVATELHLTEAAVVFQRVPVLHMGFEHVNTNKLVTAFIA